jgi:hypothetical protein
MSENVGNRFGGNSSPKQTDRPRMAEDMGTTLSQRPYPSGGKALAYGRLYAVVLTQTSERGIYPKK